MSKKINELMELHNNIVPLSVLEDELKKTGMEKQYRAKLTGSRLIVIKDNLVTPGSNLNHLKSLLPANSKTPESLSKWKKWSAREGILWQQERDKDCRLKKVSI